MKNGTKRILAAVLAMVMALSLVTPGLAARPMTGEAVAEQPSAAGEAAGLSATGVKTAGGDLESAYMEWYPAKQGITYTVKYKSNSGSWVTLTDDDTNLIREYQGYMRVDIPGLASGTCEIQAVPSDGTGGTISSGSLTVSAHDRSGFAFLERSGDTRLSSGIGAYKDDGTLKNNAVVVYVTNANKDKVALTVTTSSKGGTENCVGIQNILTAYQKGYDTRPLNVRFIGNITDPAVLMDGDILVKGSGATKRLACGITIEGIGPDTTANGWGLRIANASGVEIRNMGFMNCNSGEGDDIGLQQNNDHVWVHNCDLFYGDAGTDKDQVKGDGALDTKTSTYITHSYNHFWDNGKCNLQGMKSESADSYITYHHNWYDHSDSRHPRIRTCSVHIYNNYYDGNAKYGVGVTMGASAFVDSNFFRNCKYPMLISMQGNDSGTFSSENGGVIKAYGNKMTGQKGYTTYAQNNTSFDAYEVSSRTATVPSTVKAKQGGTTYNNFDTKLCTGSYFKVQPQSADAVATQVTKWAGRVQGGDFQWTFNNKVDDEAYEVNKDLKAALGAYSGSGILGYGGKVTQSVSGSTGGGCAHTTTRWEVTTPATCTATGLRTKICVSCNTSQGTEVIPKTDHTDDGSGTCAVCGADMGTGGNAATSGYTLRADSFTMTNGIATEYLTADEIAGVANGFYSLSSERAVKKRLFNTTDAGTDVTTAFLDVTTATAGIAFRLKDTEVPAKLYVSFGGPKSGAAGTIAVKKDGTQVGSDSYTGSSGKDKKTYTLELTAEGNYTIVAGDAAARVYSVVVEPAAEEHQWVEKTGEGYYRAPTCVADGMKTLECSKCHETTTVSIPATGEHAWGASLTKPNGDVYQVCAVCSTEEILSYGGEDEESETLDGVVIFNAADFTLADDVTTGTYTDEDMETYAPRCTIAGTNTTKGAKNGSGGRVYFARINTNDNGENGIEFTVADNSIATVIIEASSGGAELVSSVGLLDVAARKLVTVTKMSNAASTNKGNHVVVYGNENNKTVITYSGLAGGKTYRVCAPGDGDVAGLQTTARVYTIRLVESAVSGGGSGVSHVLDVATDLPTDVAEGGKTDGTTETVNDFTLYYSAKTVIGNNTKNSFAGDDSGYKGTRRLNFGGNPGTAGGSLKNVIKFTTTAAATVKVWWVQNGGYAATNPSAVRNLYIYDSADNINDATQAVARTNYEGEGVETDEVKKNDALYSTMSLSEGGTYYLANTDGNNYFFKIEVVEAGGASGVAVTGVSLNKTTMSLTTGGTGTLTATVKPAEATNQNVTWASSSESVATVSDSGVVTAVGAGTATITVTTADGGKTATCKVTVTAPSACCSSSEPHGKGTSTVMVNDGDTHYFDKDCDSNMSVKYNDGTSSSEWTADNASLIDIRTKKGISTNVRGKGVAGSTTVTVAAAGSSGISFTATMVAAAGSTTVPVTSVTLDKTTLNLTEGGSDKLTATVNPSNATDKTVSWESNKPSVATVDNDGTVTAVGVGSATITATAGGQSATCTVTVSEPSGTQTGIIAFSSAAPFAQDAANADGVKTYDNGFFTLTMSAATKIDATGARTFEEGTANEYTTPVVNTGTANQTLRLSMGAANFSSKRDTVKFHANAGDTVKVWWVGNQPDRGIQVVSDADTGTVLYKSAKVTAANQMCFDSYTFAAAGDYLLGCYNEAATNTTGGNYIFKIQVGVDNTVAVTSVTLNKSALNLEVDGEETLSATVLPENATNKTVRWSSDDTSVATVDSTGKVTAVAEGEAIITAAVGSKQDTCTVTVSTAGSGGSSVNQYVFESKNETVESVATEPKKSASNAHFSIGGASGDKVEEKGGTVNWPAQTNPNYPAYTSTQRLNLGGKVTKNNNGEHTVKVTLSANATSATFDIWWAQGGGDTNSGGTWTAKDVRNLQILDGAGVQQAKTEIVQSTTVTELGAAGRVKQYDPHFNSLTINAESGETLDTVYYLGSINSGTYIYKVVVTETVSGSAPATVPVTGVSLNKSTLSLTVGEDETLVATVSPDTATNKNVTWASDTTSVATVDSTGKVTAAGAGQAIITVTTEDGEKTATCTVTVTAAGGGATCPNNCSASNLHGKGTLTVANGETHYLDAAVTGDNIKLSSSTFTKDSVWVFSDESAINVRTTSKKGTEVSIRGKNVAGNSTVTVTTDGTTVTFTLVMVTSGSTPTTVPVTDVTLNKETMTLNVGGTEKLTPTVSPEDATDKRVTWQSSATGVATVASDGTVTAVGVGTATITVTTTDGSKTATCTVTVKRAPARPTGDQTGTVCFPDETAAYTGTDGDVKTFDHGYFTLVSSVNTKIDATGVKTFEKDTSKEYVTPASEAAKAAAIAAAQAAGNEPPAGNQTWRLNLGAANFANKHDTVEFDAQAGDVIQVWWVANKAGRGIQIMDETNTTQLGKSDAATEDNQKCYNVWEVTTTGTYLLGCYYPEGEIQGGNYILKIRVGAPVPVVVTGVRLDKTTAAMTVGGETETLTATVLPTDVAEGDKGVSWSSSNPAVATVNNGVVTAVGAGQATITVTTAVGSKTASCVVTVTAPAAATPTGVTFSFDGEDANKLVGTTATMKYSVDGGENWIDCTAGSTSLAGKTITADLDIKVKDMGNGSTTSESAVRTIDITKAEAPQLVATPPAVINGKGTIPTTAVHEYKLKTAGDDAWVAAEGSVTVDPGIYVVRVKAAGTVLASDAQEITINAFTPGKEVMPSVTFTATGYDTATMKVTGGSMAGLKYSTDNKATWSEAVTTETVELTGVAPGKLYVVKPGNGSTTVDSNAQEINVTRPESPKATKVDCSTKKNNRGQILLQANTAGTREYKKEGDPSWTPIPTTAVNNLTPGTYYVRVKANGTALASANQELTILAYDVPKAATPQVVFTATGSDTGTLTNVSSGLQYKIGETGTWKTTGEIEEIPLTELGACTIYVQDPGDEYTYDPSEIQEIEVTKAEAPAVGENGVKAEKASNLANLDGKLTGVNDTMQYRKGTGAWVDVPTGATQVTLASPEDATYYVRVKHTGSVLASEPSGAILLERYTGTPETMPNASFTATGADSGALSGVAAGMRYRMNGDTTWTDITAEDVTDGAMTLEGVLAGKIEVQQPGDGEHTTDSPIKSITVTQDAKPTVDDEHVKGVEPNDLTQKDGSIVGVSANMQYKEGADGTWTAITGTTVENLEPGTYYVRVKPEGTRLASEDSDAVVVPEYEGTPADDPNVTFSFDGGNANKLVGTTATMKYSVDGGEHWNDCVAGSTSLAGKTITADKDIQVKNMGDGVHTIPALHIQTIDITKPAAPDVSALTVTDPTDKGQNDGAIDPVTTAMQYKVGNGEWQDITGTELTGLVPATYYLRYKTTGHALASDPTEGIEVKAFVPAKEEAPKAVFTADGADKGTLSLTDGNYTRVQFKRKTTNWANLTAPVTINNAVPGTIQVKRLATNKTDESDVVTVTIAQAETPNPTVVQPGEINGKGSVTIPAGCEISTDSTNWTDATAGVNELAAGTYYVRVKCHDNVLASAPKEITLNEYIGEAAATPTGVTFSFDGSKAGILVGTTAQMEYSVTGEGGTWKPCTADETDLTGETITAADDIRIRDTGDGKHTTPSAIFTIVIIKPASPSGLLGVACEAAENNDGKITGVADTMEYRKSTDPAGQWTPVPGNTTQLTGLDAGTYYFRFKTTGHKLASDPVTVSVDKHGVLPMDGTVTITGTPKYGQTLTAQLSDTTATGDLHYEWGYSVDGGAVVSIGYDQDTYTIDPAAFSAGLVPGAVIQCAVSSDDTSGSVTGIASAVLAKADAPAAPTTLGVVKPTEVGKNDGKITGVTTAMEYQKVGETGWHDCPNGQITGLEAGDYKVRVKGTDTALDGTAADITVPVGTRDHAPKPNASFTATGDSTGTLTNVTTAMKYRLKVDDWTGSWTSITDTTVDLTELQPGTIQVYQPGDNGDGATAMDSEIQDISVTQAETPNLSGSAVKQPAELNGQGTITIPAGYQISTDGESWTDATEGDNELDAGTYYLRVKASGAVLASEPQTIVLKAYALVAAQTPTGITFEAKGSTGGYLRGAKDGMAYRVGEGELVGITEDDPLVAVSEACTIYVINKGNNTTTKDSEPASVTVLKHAAAPAGVKGEKPSTLAQADGKLTGVKANMEYQKDGADSWSDGAELTEETATGLGDGTYYVRYKAAGNTLASDRATVQVEKFTAGKAATPKAVFTAETNNKGTLSLEEGESYENVQFRRASGDWTAMSAPTTIPNAVPGTIRVRRQGNGSTTVTSEEALVTITKAGTPTVGAEDCSVIQNDNGEITGVNDTMEYRKTTDPANVWKPVAQDATKVTGLVSGTYQVRVKASGSKLASEAAEVTIGSYTAIAANTPDGVSFSFDGSDPWKLKGTTATMQYSLDGGSKWFDCAEGATDLKGKAITAEGNIKIKDLGNGTTTTESEVFTITIDKAEPPTGLSSTHCTTSANNDGTITGLNNTMEWCVKHSLEWVPVGEGVDTITGLAPNIYCIRTKATGTTLPSEATHLEVDDSGEEPALEVDVEVTADGVDLSWNLDDGLDEVDAAAGCILAQYDPATNKMLEAAIGKLTIGADGKSGHIAVKGADLSKGSWVLFLLDGDCKPVCAKRPLSGNGQG